jgi:hypothetical protein
MQQNGVIQESRKTKIDINKLIYNQEGRICYVICVSQKALEDHESHK